MKVLGVDQSFTSTGVVLMEQGSDLIQHHQAIRSTKDQDMHHRVREIYQGITALVEQHKPDHLVIEGLAFGIMGNATRDLGGLFYVITDRLRYDLGFNSIHVVAPTSLKKFATGSGKAKKPEMHTALPDHAKDLLKKHYKKTSGLSDIVDAYWLAKWGIANLNA